jgi:hypothetical protein
MAVIMEDIETLEETPFVCSRLALGVDRMGNAWSEGEKFSVRCEEKSGIQTELEFRISGTNHYIQLIREYSTDST